MKSPVPIIALSDTTCQYYEMCHGLLGKKDQSTNVDLRYCLMQSDVDFHRMFLLHQRSKVISNLGHTRTFRVQRLNDNQM